MRPQAKYEFIQSEIATGSFILENTEGKEFYKIPEYVKKNHFYLGRKHLEYGLTRNEKQAKKHKYTFTIGGEHFSGVNNMDLYPLATYGDDKNKKLSSNFLHSGINPCNALLFIFGMNEKKLRTLTLYVFENQADNSKTIFEKWTAKTLCLTVDPLPIGQEKTLDNGN